MRRKNRAFGIHANSVHAGGDQFISSPFFDGGPGLLPELLLEMASSTSQALILYTNHVRGSGPVVGVSIPGAPLFALFLVLVGFPVFGQQFAKRFRRPDLLEAGVGVVLHGLRLTEGHGEAISLGFVAGVGLFAVVLSASLDEVFIKG